MFELYRSEMFYWQVSFLCFLPRPFSGLLSRLSVSLSRCYFSLLFACLFCDSCQDPFQVLCNKDWKVRQRSNSDKSPQIHLGSNRVRAVFGKRVRPVKRYIRFSEKSGPVSHPSEKEENVGVLCVCGREGATSYRNTSVFYFPTSPHHGILKTFQLVGLLLTYRLGDPQSKCV